jgi:hypothetical protein
MLGSSMKPCEVRAVMARERVIHPQRRQPASGRSDGSSRAEGAPVGLAASDAHGEGRVLQTIPGPGDVVVNHRAGPGRVGTSRTSARSNSSAKSIGN